jgi:hypothetical protein
MDALARGVVAAVPYTSDADLQRWLDRVDQECKAIAANGDGTDWEEVKSTLNTWTQEDIPPEIVASFVQYVEYHCSAPIDVLKRIGQSGENLLQAYSQGLGWVSPGQRAQLEQLQAARGDWRDWLPSELDEHWAGWRASTPDVLAPWLGQILPRLRSSATAEEPTPAADPTPAQAPAVFDQAEWDAYRHRWNGEWDGTEDKWADFAARFAYYAPEGFRAKAEQLMRDIGGQADKVAALAAAGVAVARPVPAEPATPASGATEAATGAGEKEAQEFVDHVAGEAKAKLYAMVSELAAEWEVSEDEARALIDEELAQADVSRMVVTALADAE